MKDILFVVDDDKVGGVSIVLEDILNRMDYKKYNVDLLILNKCGEKLTKIPDQVNEIDCANFFENVSIPFKDVIASKKIFKILKKIYLIFLMKTKLIKYKVVNNRKKILNKKYDTEIAFKYGFSTIFAYFGDSNNKINWIHCDCDIMDPFAKYQALAHLILPKFNYNVALSNSIKINFLKHYNCAHKTVIINNIIDDIKITEKIRNAKYHKTKKIKFVTVGRLAEQKGYDRLIEAFKLLKAEGYEDKIELSIIGDGELKEQLFKMVEDFNLNDCIQFLGRKDNPFSYIKDSDCFILSSVWEAYPLVIIEAFITGVPVLSTKIASAYEMIDDRKNGIIVDHSSLGIYNGILEIIRNPQMLEKMKSNLINYKYKNDVIMKEIEEIINN